MPICIPNDLPAYKILRRENVCIISVDKATHQDIRPLRVAIINLMPTKIETETQLLRLLGNTPLQVDITLIKIESYTSKNTSEKHLSTFYKTFSKAKDEYFDGLIITGAPIEQLSFEQVAYWHELCDIMEWSKSHVFSTIHICWGAQAGLYYHYGIKKHQLDKKLFGIYPQKVLLENHPLLKGFDDEFNVPQSRYTEVLLADILSIRKLELLAASEMSGAHLISDRTCRQIFITGHIEYDRDTLKTEYFRDIDKGHEIDLPYNYFPDNNTMKEPVFSWRGHANLMYSNWLNSCVYQETPFDSMKISPLKIITTI